MVKLTATDADKMRWQALLISCDHCGQAFASLSEAYLCYEQPRQVGRKAPCHWTHRRCANAKCRLWRADLALAALVRTMTHREYLHLARQDAPRMIHPTY